MKPSEIIQGALDILDSPEKWCRGVLARDEHGGEVVPYARKARSFCIDGALLLASGVDAQGISYRDPNRLARREAVRFLDRRVPEGTPELYPELPTPYVSFNDWHVTTYEDVRLLLKVAYGDAVEAGQ